MGGVSCCLSAAALYLLGRSSGRHAEALKSVARDEKRCSCRALAAAANRSGQNNEVHMESLRMVQMGPRGSDLCVICPVFLPSPIK
ncbi:hypothetical protein OIU84_025297 [Salix udensis]|uniref:Uncharacterized protein n=1 Tax=Salix udensis TaxID=889485 RepID=A0AAD6KKI6_9ROSI|nr:hypothetical protein OIU84_025297 [Salix udensis]